MKRKTSIFLGILSIIMITAGLVLQFLIPSNDKDSNLQYKNYEEVVLNVDSVENSLTIHTKNNKYFNGFKDTVRAKDIIRAKAPGLIKKVSESCLDFNSEYNCLYEIGGEDAKKTTYIVSGLDNQGKQASIGIDYADSMLKVQTLKAKSMEFIYKKSISLNGVNGNFMLSLNDYEQENNTWDFFVSILKISGSTKKDANIKLLLVDDHFELTSNVEIENLKVEGEDIYTLDTITSSVAKSSSKNYKITFVNNKFIIE